MATGHLVTLTSDAMAPGNSVAADPSSFVMAKSLGIGTVAEGSVPGVFMLGTDGLVYFVPAQPLLAPTTITAAPGEADFAADYGTSGDNSLTGSPGGDTIMGGSYADNTGAAPSGNDTIDGGAGDDLLFGGTGNDRLLGAAGNDFLGGGSGSDHLSGGAGSDTLNGGAGADTIDGGTNLDYVDYRDSDAAVDVDLGRGGAQSGGHAEGDVLSGVDGILGSAFNDTLRGFDGHGTGADDYTNVFYGGAGDDILSGMGGPDSLYGDEGRDSLYGGSGDDLLSGGADDDLLDGGSGADLVDGGAGNDRILLSEGHGNDTVHGGEGIDTLDGGSLSQSADVLLHNGTGTFDIGGQTVTFDSIEALVTGSGDDLIDSSTSTQPAHFMTGAGNDSVYGGEGDETIDGGSGNDTLYGGAGADLIHGDEGDDKLFGGAGDDQLFGGEGDDILYGDAGNDTLYGGGGQNRLDGGADADDIHAGPGDTVDGGEEGDDRDTLYLAPGRWRITYDELNPENGIVTYYGDDGDVIGTVNFQNIEKIICFTPGTMIRTVSGWRPVETLQPGDMVLTRDHGLQPIRWIGQRRVEAAGHLAPVRIRKGTLHGLDRDLLVSPQHRMLFHGHTAELLFGESEVLAPAIALVDGRMVTQEPGGMVTYIHMMFDRHQLIMANSCWTESLHPGDQALEGLSPAGREELFALFPDLRSLPQSYGPTARRTVRSHEARVLAALNRT